MKTLVSHINKALKIGKDISKFSTYSCHPATRNELKSIVYDRIDKDGPNCNLNDIDVNQITDMSWLFNESSFNGNISDWDVSKVKYMAWMFSDSVFNKPIGDWDVSNVDNMSGMFARSKFNQPIGNWDVSNVNYVGWMFANSDFDQDISGWNIRQDVDSNRMFMKCPIREEYKPTVLQQQ